MLSSNQKCVEHILFYHEHLQVYSEIVIVDEYARLISLRSHAMQCPILIIPCTSCRESVLDTTRVNPGFSASLLLCL